MTKLEKELAKFFDTSKTKNQTYTKVMALLRSLGATIDERKTSGSTVFIELKHKTEDFNRVTSLHKPHPAKELKPYAVKSLREFLTGLGYKP